MYINIETNLPAQDTGRLKDGTAISNFPLFLIQNPSIVEEEGYIFVNEE